MYKRVPWDAFIKVDLFPQVHHKDEARHIAAAGTLLKTRIGDEPAPRRRLLVCCRGIG